MTITRLAQYTAETLVQTDFAYIPADNLSRPSISSTKAKTGTYSYRHHISSGAMGYPSNAGLSAVRCGYWFNNGDGSPPQSGILLVGASCAANSVRTSAFNIHLRYNTGNGTIDLRRPDDSGDYETLASAPIPAQFATLDTWFHVGWTHKIDASEGFYSLYVDGIQVLNFVGDTRPSRLSGIFEYSTTATRFFGIGGAAINTSWDNSFQDDIYFDDITGEEDAPVPARRFGVVLRTGAGADDDWTPVPTADNYENVGDNPNDGDATYNKALAADLRDTFAFGDITLPADHRIVAVLPSPFAKRLDSEVANGLSVHAWDGSQYLDSDDLDLTMSYGSPVFARFTTMPNGQPWSESGFNNMQFGYRSRGDFD